jgi:hypothetical protein
MIKSAPTVSELVVSAAVPSLCTGAVPSTVAPCAKLTVPVGAAPGVAGVIVAVSTTAVPDTADGAEDARVVVVNTALAGGVILWVRAADALPV